MRQLCYFPYATNRLDRIIVFKLHLALAFLMEFVDIKNYPDLSYS